MSDQGILPTAKVYAFPTRPRDATRRIAGPGDRTSRPVPSAARLVSTAFGSGWYHEDAIRDADPVAKP